MRRRTATSRRAKKRATTTRRGPSPKPLPHALSLRKRSLPCFSRLSRKSRSIPWPNRTSLHLPTSMRISTEASTTLCATCVVATPARASSLPVISHRPLLGQKPTKASLPYPTNRSLRARTACFASRLTTTSLRCMPVKALKKMTGCTFLMITCRTCSSLRASFLPGRRLRLRPVTMRVQVTTLLASTVS